MIYSPEARQVRFTSLEAFARYLHVYTMRRPSSITRRRHRTDAAMIRLSPAKPDEALKPLVFNKQYQIDTSRHIDIRYFAILDMVERIDSEKDARDIRNLDSIYTERVPWKRIRMSFLEHILNEHGYRVIRG